MKQVSIHLASAIILLILCAGVSSAQKKSKQPVHSQVKVTTEPAVSIPAPVTPTHPTEVAIENMQGIPAPPSFTVNILELKFGSQGVGVESCMYVTINNTSPASQTLTGLGTDDAKHYTIPSPSVQMLPMSVPPHSNVTISICFKPEKVGEFKTRLVIKTPEDSIVIPVEGKGIKPEDVGKLPKTDMSFVWKKKGRDGKIKLQLISSSKVTLELYDDLGNLKVSFLHSDFKNEGVYEIPFDGLDKAKARLPEGSYYIRCVIDDISRGALPIKITRVVEMPD